MFFLQELHLDYASFFSLIVNLALPTKALKNNGAYLGYVVTHSLSISVQGDAEAEGCKRSLQLPQRQQGTASPVMALEQTKKNP